MENKNVNTTMDFDYIYHNIEMDTQKLLEGVCELAPIINEGKKAFTESEQLKDKIIEWYGHHETKLESEKEGNGFFIWNPKKLK